MASSDLSEILGRLESALEQRGARNVEVGGTVGLQSYGEQDTPGGSVDVSYTGDQQWLRNACAEVDGVAFSDVDSTEWPGGDVLVDGEIVVVEPGERAATPGGEARNPPPQHPNARCATDVPPPAESEVTQDPHCARGDTWAIADENGITDECRVIVWVVRNWTPRPDTPALLVLRYIPDAKAGGLEWWSGYVRAAPEDGLGSVDWQALRNRLEVRRVQHQGHEVPISYHDSSGWVGWSATSLPVEVAGIPIMSTVGTEVAQMDNQEAGRITEQYAQAALDARREVLR